MNNRGDNMFLGASPDIFRNADKLRKEMTIAEQLLWEELKSKKLNGYKFRRQHALGNYIADFYCHRKKLVIELDGSIHNLPDQEEYDTGRTESLIAAGIRVIRFRNERIINHMKEVLDEIKTILNEMK